jgi:predicted SAM-dependent methyltransferase
LDSPFDEEYFTAGTTGYKGYEDFPINEYKVEKILRCKPKSVLEVGCANGFIVEKLNSLGIPAWGIDVSKYAVENRAHPNVIEGDVLDIPFKDCYFDFVYSSDMLEHVPEDQVKTAIDEMRRVANRGLLEITYEKTPMDIDDTHVTMKPYEWWRDRVPKQFDLNHPDEYALKLNIGCFTSFFMFHDTWINIDKLDLMPMMQRRCRFVQSDVSVRIPYPDNAAKMIYHSDILEHFSYHEAIAFLKECHRVLKPGGLMRVCVPNLFQILSDYKNGSIDEHNDVQPEEFTEVNAPSLKLSMLLFGSVGSSQNNYRGHQMMYNFDGVKEVLESVGFVDVIPKPIDTSQSPFMCNKDVHRDMELIVECRK